jgi:hypothetical protein
MPFMLAAALLIGAALLAVRAAGRVPISHDPPPPVAHNPSELA